LRFTQTTASATACVDRFELSGSHAHVVCAFSIVALPPTDGGPFDRVEIGTDRFASEGAPRGTVGYVIERWNDGALEVEVMRSDGSTAAQFVAQPCDLHLASATESLQPGSTGTSCTTSTPGCPGYATPSASAGDSHPVLPWLFKAAVTFALNPLQIHPAQPPQGTPDNQLACLLNSLEGTDKVQTPMLS
jgi:hypothetical protein